MNAAATAHITVEELNPSQANDQTASPRSRKPTKIALHPRIYAPISASYRDGSNQFGSIKGEAGSAPDQLAPDQHASDLVGASADVEQLGVAEISFDRPVLGVAGAAQRLDRLAGDLHRILARQQDRAGRVEARRPPRVASPRDLVDIGPRRIQRDIHVSDLGLHQLEAADRLAELLALADIGQDDVEARLHDPDLDSGEHRALVIEAAHQHLGAAILLAHHVLGRDEAIVEHQLAGWRSAHAELVDLLARREAFHPPLDHEGGDAFAALT